IAPLRQLGQLALGALAVQLRAAELVVQRAHLLLRLIERRPRGRDGAARFVFRRLAPRELLARRRQLLLEAEPVRARLLAVRGELVPELLAGAPLFFRALAPRRGVALALLGHAQ